MTDNYLGFKYNKIHSFKDKTTSGFEAFILNDGLDLFFSNTPNFSDSFAFPKFGETSYFLGNTKENRTFNLTVLVREVSLVNYRKFLNWLNLDDSGYLIFDYNPNFGYKVKVSSITEGQFTVNKSTDQECLDPNNPTYNVELSISFTTINFPWALELNVANEADDYKISFAIDGSFSFIGNSFSISYSEDESDGNFLTLENFSNMNHYYKFIYNGTDLSIIDGLNTLYEYSGVERQIIIFSQYGVTVDSISKSFINLLESDSFSLKNESKTLQLFLNNGSLTIEVIAYEIL